MKRIGAVRESRNVFAIFKKPKSRTPQLALPPLKQAASATSTQDIPADAVSEEVQLPQPNKNQARSDREAVRAENAQVYSQDIEHEDGIRLLRIQPGTDEICATLEYYDLESPPQYDGLSYCWGAQQELEVVQVDGKDFRVSKHLYAAMRRLRRPSRDRLIWIDVICVNQANIPERNASVQLMWKIYAKAHRVIVWVGETEPQAPTCKRQFSASKHDDSQLVWCTQPGLAALEHDHVSKKLGDVLQQLEWASNVTHGDVWWKRLWVIQEFSRAREHPTVYIGPHAIGWNFFAQLMKTDTHDRLPLFHHLRSQEEQSLLQLLFMAKDFYCSDPRDRIYALLGLVKGGTTSIKPDYAEPVPQVYEDATMYLLQSERNLDVLLDGRLERSGGGYPTWVPHFTMLRDRKLIQTLDGYEAGRGDPVVSLERQPIECEICTSHTGRALKVKAVPFGRITYRSSEKDLPAPDSTHRVILKNHDHAKPELSRPLQTVDAVFECLKINFSQEPYLQLDRAKGLSYLILDYLFGGETSAVAEHTRIERVRTTDDMKIRTAREIDKLVKKYDMKLTDAVRLDLNLTALWENAFITVRHKGLYTPDEEARRFLSDEKEMYHVPSKLRRRDFFITDNGFMGMGPATLEPGDEIIVPFGASRPFIVRKHGEDHYVLIGDAVVPGIMPGQLVNLYKEGSVEACDYLLR
ncbi:hypothetical protein LTR86_010035 [Recurvomyces mirabilis]|nr:hypothetical protein LTR86_010035 [Recurvomyces mirabilis]